MTARKDKPPASSNISDMIKTLDGDVLMQLEVVYKRRMFRYLFDGGATVDVVAVADNSDLRSWVLATTGLPGIVGCTIVEGSDE